MITDLYFQLIVKYWADHFRFIQNGGTQEGAAQRKSRFIQMLSEYLPVTNVLYTDQPSQIDLTDTVGVISITCPFVEGMMPFPSAIGKCQLLIAERVNGYYTALYSEFTE